MRWPSQHKPARPPPLLRNSSIRQRRGPARHSGTLRPRAPLHDANLHTRFYGKIDRGLRQDAPEGVRGRQKEKGKRQKWKMKDALFFFTFSFCLKRRCVVPALARFNLGLARCVIACSRHGFEPPLVNRFSATLTLTVSAFVNSAERLVYLCYSLRIALTKPQ